MYTALCSKRSLCCVLCLNFWQPSCWSSCCCTQMPHTLKDNAVVLNIQLKNEMKCRMINGGIFTQMCFHVFRADCVRNYREIPTWVVDLVKHVELKIQMCRILPLSTSISLQTDDIKICFHNKRISTVERAWTAYARDVVLRMNTTSSLYCCLTLGPFPYELAGGKTESSCHIRTCPPRVSKCNLLVSARNYIQALYFASFK